MVKHGRLPWLRPAELSSDARAVYDRIAEGPRSGGPQHFRFKDAQGRLEGPFNAMLVAPVIGEALQELGSAIRYRSTLSDRGREIAVLTVAAARRCEYEWYAHARVARGTGLSEIEIEAIGNGEVPETLGDAEQALQRATIRLLEQRRLDDESFDDVISVLGPQQLMELVVVIGYYDLLDLVMRVWDTPPPRGVRPRWASG